MPWINQNLCIGCGICIGECPVDAIAMDDANKAWIDDARCVRCGVCHDVCPENAIRHDGERLPLEKSQKLEEVLRYLSFCKTAEEKRALLERLARHYRRLSKVAADTVTAIQNVGDDPETTLREAVEKLREKWEETMANPPAEL